MASANPPQGKRLPPLENGDNLDQKTFHARYLAKPEDCRAELVGGIVYVPSPRKVSHGKVQQLVVRWLDEYMDATQGTRALLNITQIPGPDSELEPDACLFIISECGGRVYVDADDHLHGAPELIVEVSSATESIDLHRKKLDYQKTGVIEYVVLALRTQQVFWFIRQRGKCKEVPLPKMVSFVHGRFRAYSSMPRRCCVVIIQACLQPSGKAWLRLSMRHLWASCRGKRRKNEDEEGCFSVGKLAKPSKSLEVLR